MISPMSEAYYGLPNNVKFCRRCVISNQRPSSAAEHEHTRDSKKSVIRFDSDGVCDACQQAEIKSLVDWDAREQELLELCEKYRKNDGSYDCIVPGSGGKDSSFQSHVLKYKYGMNPLTITWAPNLYTDWGLKNFHAWSNSGFDNYLITPNRKVHRLLTRLAIDTLFHPFQPFMIGQKSVIPKIAAKLNIPLVFYGENEAEYGNSRQENNSAQRSWEYFSSNDKSKIHISGVSISELEERYSLNKQDLAIYMPENPDVLRDAGIDVRYLGYYLRWHPQGVYYYASENAGFQASPERTAGTYSKYHSIDDKIDDFHFYTTYIKFGIGRASYDAAQEIRNGEITRDEGLALVRKFDGEYPSRFEKELFSYLSIENDEYGDVSKQFSSPRFDREYFEQLCNQFRSPHLWEKADNYWKLKHTVFEETE